MNARQTDATDTRAATALTVLWLVLFFLAGIGLLWAPGWLDDVVRRVGPRLLALVGGG